MNRFSQQIRAAYEMRQSVGTGPTFERILNYARAQRLNLQREHQFRRMELKGLQPRSILGSKMVLDPEALGLDRDLLLDGIREPVATGHILSVLESDDVVLEVGANIGYYALIESRICRKVYAAEPHPGNYKRLNDNIALNGRSNVETFNIAFGETDAPLYLDCSTLSNWHSCKGADAESVGTIKVDGYCIDTFVDGKLAPTFMKMDVEGFELQVLRGSAKTLATLKRLFVEVHGDLLEEVEIAEIIDLIADAGLRPSLIVQYDRPGLSKIYPITHLDQIRAGDRGTYELFFERA